ncbi:MAG: TIR domain-containing protein [Pseudonocardiales bacterium]|nr:TIR domain-containing protein [Pseudonocardiales bacterium]
MGSSREQLPDLPTPPQPAVDSVRREAPASGQARVDQDLRYWDGAGAASGYDAFISYSHALDGALAPALQTGLERFAKPWYRSRVLRVFRDTTNLAANPGLWTSIEEALAASAWLVLMASPTAAQSKWVNREIAWWLANKSPQRLLVVLTKGEFAWADDAGGDGRASAALPPALRGAFREEPHWVDLRWLHDVDQVDQSNPRLRDCVADIAAAVREVPKDELIGEHIRQRRHTRQLVCGAITALAVLLIAALVAAVIAFQQRATAQRERDTAIFNRITAEADRMRNTDMSLAAQLDLTAYRMQPTPDLYTTLVTDSNAALSTLLTGHTDSVRGVAFSPDGHTLATTSADRTVRLWNITDPGHPTALSPPLTGHTRTVGTVAFSPDGHTLATTSDDQTVRLWNVTDPAHPTALGPPLSGHTNTVGTVAFSPDGHTLATGSADQTVRLWNVADPAHPTPLDSPLTGHTNYVTAVAFSPDGHTLASASNDRTVRLWDIPPTLRTGHTSTVNAVAFSPDGHILTTSGGDRTVRLWNVTDPAHPTALGSPLSGHTNAVFSVAFSPDGHTLATGSADQTVRLWNVTDPAHPTALSSPLTGHTSAVSAVAFSPDRRTLATGSRDQTVRLWNVADPAHPTPLGPPLTGHTNTVRSVVFSPDGHTLATGSADQTIRLWNITDPTHPTPVGQPLTGHTNWVNAVVFSPDGHTLATGSDDQTVRLWEMNVDQAIQRICATTANTLTPAKWAQYVSPDLPYHPPCP